MELSRAAAPARCRAGGRRSRRIAATPPGLLHVSVLTMGEIGQGIARIRGRGDQDQASALERWLRDLESGFGDRVLPVTLPVTATWGRRGSGSGRGDRS